MKDTYLPPDWSDKTKLEKILSVISIIFALIAVIFMIISFTSKHNFYYIYYTSIFIFLFTKGIEYWKYSRIIATIDFICSIIFLIAEVIMLAK